MALINIDITKQQRATQQIASRVNNLYTGLISQFRSLFESVWANPDATPQEIFNLLGTDGTKLFDLADAMIAMINTADPNNPQAVVIPHAVTKNPDGTVAIGDPIQGNN